MAKSATKTTHAQSVHDKLEQLVQELLVALDEQLDKWLAAIHARNERMDFRWDYEFITDRDACFQKFFVPFEV